LNRQAFISHLGKTAQQLDIDTQLHDRISIDEDFNSDFVIDASGCPSTLKRKYGFNRGIKGVTLQQTLTDCNVFNPKTIRIYYSQKFGYYWIFPRDPKSKEVNVGIGFIHDFGYDLKKLLEEFKKCHAITGSVAYVSGGLIPLGLQPPQKYNNILFVGDAGVGAFPFSGQGIYRALLSGHTAGQLIACRKEKKYPYIMKKMFIKWDILGKIFIHLNLQLRKINESFVLYTHNKFMGIDEILHI
jgi:flavin-dependent dehydrogenase